ncbi:hypothetical protein KY311_03485 [Candidatus Woesearchaeota archaeon]|nr:hypothetical protein [Candidatus Woesearchaeota archaeon]MBW3017169.1 hypothetical protein [Candidatus Woesearchaeota archaeon]
MALKFWKKKKEEDDLGGLEKTPLPGSMPEADFEDTTRSPEFDVRPSSPDLGIGSAPSYQASPGQDIVAKNLEIISAKIDALRASLDALSQRLANIERIALAEQDKSKRAW